MKEGISPGEEQQRGKLKAGLTFIADHSVGALGVISSGAAVDQMRKGNHKRGALLGGAGALLIGTDVANTYARKRIQKWEALSGTLDVSKFVQSPNPTADIIEELFNISFDKPVKVEYTDVNRRIHKANDPKQADMIKSRLNEDSEGIYDPIYNVFFVLENAHWNVDLHENGHALIDQINPEMYALNQAYSNGNRGLTTEDVERYVSGLCFNEGAAVLIEHESTLRHLENLSRRGEYFDFEAYVRNIDTNVFNIDISEERVSVSRKPLVEGDNQLLLEATALYDAARQLEITGPYALFRQAQLYKQARSLLSGNRYRIGANFAYSGFAALKKSGMHSGEALVALVTTPPPTIDDLLHPERYATEKLLGKSS